MIDTKLSDLGAVPEVTGSSLAYLVQGLQSYKTTIDDIAAFILDGVGVGTMETRSSDYAASDANRGRMWMRVDSQPNTVRTVIESGLSGTSTWSAGGNLGTARSSLAGCGTQSAGLSFGGFTTVAVATTEEYAPSGYAYAVKTFAFEA